jgi:hypothetical protein
VRADPDAPSQPAIPRGGAFSTKSAERARSGGDIIFGIGGIDTFAGQLASRSAALST